MDPYRQNDAQMSWDHPTSWTKVGTQNSVLHGAWCCRFCLPAHWMSQVCRLNSEAKADRKLTYLPANIDPERKILSSERTGSGARSRPAVMPQKSAKLIAFTKGLPLRRKPPRHLNRSKWDHTFHTIVPEQNLAAHDMS